MFFKKLTRTRSKYTENTVSTKNENTNHQFVKNLKDFGKYHLYPNTEQGLDVLSKQLNLTKDQLVLGAGSEQILKHLFILLPYKKIQIIEHSYEMAMYYNKMLDKQIILNKISLNNEGDFVCEDIVKLGGDVLYLVNPHCPTGLMFDIEKYANKFKYIIVDEAYVNPLSKILNCNKNTENIITVRTFSKLGGVPGLRLGYAMGSKKIISQLNCLRDCYETTTEAIEYLNFISTNADVLEQNQTQLLECYNLLKSREKCFSKYCSNFAIFKSVNFKGKQYNIDNETYTRVTLTNPDNYESLYNR